MKETQGEMRDELKWVMLSKIKTERKERRHEPLRWCKHQNICTKVGKRENQSRHTKP
jgi:hypothetical protein